MLFGYGLQQDLTAIALVGGMLAAANALLFLWNYFFGLDWQAFKTGLLPAGVHGMVEELELSSPPPGPVEKRVFGFAASRKAA